MAVRVVGGRVVRVEVSLLMLRVLALGPSDVTALGGPLQRTRPIADSRSVERLLDPRVHRRRRVLRAAEAAAAARLGPAGVALGLRLPQPGMDWGGHSRRGICTGCGVVDVACGGLWWRGCGGQSWGSYWSRGSVR